MKKILVAILVILISTAGCSKKTSDEHANTNSDAIGKAVANTALQVSEIDVSAISGVSEKIKGACARNKYGLSEEACIQTIEDRKAICVQQTAQKYPGQLSHRQNARSGFQSRSMLIPEIMDVLTKCLTHPLGGTSCGAH